MASVRVAAGASLARLLAVDVQAAEMVAVQVENEGPSALTGFELRGKARPEAAAAVTLKAGGFTVPDFFLVYGVGDPATLGAGESCLLVLNTGFLAALEVFAASASGASLRVHTS